MNNETNKSLSLVPSAVDGFVLTDDERQLISNFRKLKGGAKTMLLDLSFTYARTLPAARVRVRLVRASS